jgi:hypothetical protein
MVGRFRPSRAEQLSFNQIDQPVGPLLSVPVAVVDQKVIGGTVDQGEKRVDRPGAVDAGARRSA